MWARGHIPVKKPVEGFPLWKNYLLGVWGTTPCAGVPFKDPVEGSQKPDRALNLNWKTDKTDMGPS